MHLLTLSHMNSWLYRMNIIMTLPFKISHFIDSILFESFINQTADEFICIKHIMMSSLYPLKAGYDLQSLDLHEM